MAVKGRSSADRISLWEVLINNLKSDVPQMPHLADEFHALEQMLPQARILATQQEDLRSQARGVSDALKKMLRDGDHLRARLGSMLKGKLGFSEATLAKYGFNPAPQVRRLSKSRAKKAKGAPAATATAATATPVAPETHPAAPAPTPGK